jgi:riboflavin biosynthesis pyrimidine reductase
MAGLREPLEPLYDAGEGPGPALPEALETSYGGPLRLGESWTIANFVSSLDGVVAIPSETQSSSIVSDRSEADRFVMALLRASADAIVIGSGTLRASPRSHWTAERVFPAAADELAELRRRLGVPTHPLLAVLTGSGSVDLGHPALEEGALVLSTAAGAERLHGRLPAASEVVAVAGEESVDVRAAVALLRARGFVRILSEAGPTVMGSLLTARVVDELFLTLSALVAGRSREEARPGLAEGVAFLPGTRIAGRLTGVRRHGAHLFLRYRLES